MSSETEGRSRVSFDSHTEHVEAPQAPPSDETPRHSRAPLLGDGSRSMTWRCLEDSVQSVSRRIERPAASYDKKTRPSDGQQSSEEDSPVVERRLDSARPVSASRTSTDEEEAAPAQTVAELQDQPALADLYDAHIDAMERIHLAHNGVVRLTELIRGFRFRHSDQWMRSDGDEEFRAVWSYLRERRAGKLRLIERLLSRLPRRLQNAAMEVVEGDLEQLKRDSSGEDGQEDKNGGGGDDSEGSESAHGRSASPIIVWKNVHRVKFATDLPPDLVSVFLKVEGDSDTSSDDDEVYSDYDEDDDDYYNEEYERSLRKNLHSSKQKGGATRHNNPHRAAGPFQPLATPDQVDAYRIMQDADLAADGSVMSRRSSQQRGPPSQSQPSQETADPASKTPTLPQIAPAGRSFTRDDVDSKLTDSQRQILKRRVTRMKHDQQQRQRHGQPTGAKHAENKGNNYLKRRNSLLEEFRRPGGYAPQFRRANNALPNGMHYNRSFPFAPGVKRASGLPVQMLPNLKLSSFTSAIPQNRKLATNCRHRFGAWYIPSHHWQREDGDVVRHGASRVMDKALRRRLLRDFRRRHAGARGAQNTQATDMLDDLMREAGVAGSDRSAKSGGASSAGGDEVRSEVAQRLASAMGSVDPRWDHLEGADDQLLDLELRADTAEADQDDAEDGVEGGDVPGNGSDPNGEAAKRRAAALKAEQYREMLSSLDGVAQYKEWFLEKKKQGMSWNLPHFLKGV